MSAVQVKCYLIDNNMDVANKRLADFVHEIRRFNMVFDVKSTGNYDRLLSKIHEVFGNVVFSNIEQIRTFWIDSENDLIQFSSEIEYRDFLNSNEANKTSYKLYVMKAKDANEKEKEKFDEYAGIPCNFQEIFNKMFHNGAEKTNLQDIFKNIFPNGKLDDQSGVFGDILKNLKTQFGDDLFAQFSNQKTCSDEIIKECVDKLKSMGYSNDDDLLTKLAKHHNGNVQAIINILAF